METAFWLCGWALATLVLASLVGSLINDPEDDA